MKPATGLACTRSRYASWSRLDTRMIDGASAAAARRSATTKPSTSGRPISSNTTSGERPPPPSRRHRRLADDRPAVALQQPLRRGAEATRSSTTRIVGRHGTRTHGCRSSISNQPGVLGKPGVLVGDEPVTLEAPAVFVVAPERGRVDRDREEIALDDVVPPRRTRLDALPRGRLGHLGPVAVGLEHPRQAHRTEEGVIEGLGEYPGRETVRADAGRRRRLAGGTTDDRDRPPGRDQDRKDFPTNRRNDEAAPVPSTAWSMPHACPETRSTLARWQRPACVGP